MRVRYLVPKGLEAQQAAIRLSQRKECGFVLVIHDPSTCIERIVKLASFPDATTLGVSDTIGKSLLLGTGMETEARVVFERLKKANIRCALFEKGRAIARHPELR